MNDRRIGTGSLFLLAVIFTAGLTFATVELPALLDRFLHDTIATPSGDSHADDGDSAGPRVPRTAAVFSVLAPKSSFRSRASFVFLSLSSSVKWT